MDIGILTSFFRDATIPIEPTFQVCKETGIKFIRFFVIEMDWKGEDKILYPYQKDAQGKYNVIIFSESYANRLQDIKAKAEFYQIPVIISLFDQIHISWNDWNLWTRSPYYPDNNVNGIFIRNFPDPISNYLHINSTPGQIHEHYILSILNAMQNSGYARYEIINEPDCLEGFPGYSRQELEAFQGWVREILLSFPVWTCNNIYDYAKYGQKNSIHGAGSENMNEWLNQAQNILNDMGAIPQYFSMDGSNVKNNTVQVAQAIKNRWGDVYDLEILFDHLSDPYPAWKPDSVQAYKDIGVYDFFKNVVAAVSTHINPIPAQYKPYIRNHVNWNQMKNTRPGIPGFAIKNK